MAQTTSDIWKELLTINGTTREYAFDINGNWYGPEEDAEVSHSVNRELFSEFGIGNATTAKLSLVIWVADIPKGSTIKRYVRLRYKDQSSEWLPNGVFYSSKRVDDDGRWTVDAFDAIRKADVVWTPDATLNFPLSMPEAISEFARIMGIEVDARTVLNESYYIDYPTDGTTIRNELCWIAAAHGGNFVMTDEGALRLVPLIPVDGEGHNVDLDVISFENAGAYKPVSRVTLISDSNTSFTSGDDTGYEISSACPTATQKMADAILATTQSYVYHSYSAEATGLDPAAELGDCITIGGITSIVASIKDAGYGFPDVSAPGVAEQEEDEPYVAPMQQEINRQAAQNRSLIEKTEERILLEVESQAGDIANLEVNASEIEARVQSAEGEISVLQQDSGKVRVTVVDQEGTLQTTIDADSWEAIRKNLAGETTSGFWFDFDAGQFVFDGTGEFRSKDGLSYITIEGNEIVLYSSSSGTLLDKLRIGFIAGQDPSGSQDVDYPYILLGNTTSSGGSGLIKKFWDGLFIGNSYAKNASGRFSPTADYAGFFVDTLTGTSYVVSGTDMQNVYTGEAIAKFG